MTQGNIGNTVANILKGALAERRTRNAAYSLRSFARDIGVSPSFASMLINGRKRLSLDKAFHISKAMRMNEEDRIQFLRAVAESSCPDMELMQDLRKVFALPSETGGEPPAGLLKSHSATLRELNAHVTINSQTHGRTMEAKDQFNLSVRTDESKRPEVIEMVNEFRERLRQLEQHESAEQ